MVKLYHQKHHKYYDPNAYNYRIISGIIMALQIPQNENVNAYNYDVFIAVFIGAFIILKILLKYIYQTTVKMKITMVYSGATEGLYVCFVFSNVF